MSRKSSNLWAALPRLLYNHNPLYPISALLVLFGMHRVVDAQTSAVGGPLLMELFCGYAALLAVVAFLIVRFGQVWDDARTILLVLVLLFVALSASFDRIVLENPLAGAKCLLEGLLFAVLVTEAVLWSLRMRLPMLYRVPYYWLLVLLFCYPMRLGQLSLDGHDALVGWTVFSFPLVAGVVLLTLLPAARRNDRRGAPNGTPWRWPLYPWSLFVVLLVATALRSYSLGMSFETGHNMESSFRPYFLLPLLLAGAALLLELGITSGNAKARAVALALPAGLVWLGLPGIGSGHAAQFTSWLSDALASPAQLTIYGLILFYAIAWLRGLRWAELGLIVGLALAAVVDRQTLDLDTLAVLQWPPLLLLAMIEIGLGVRRRASWRLMIGMLAAALTAVVLGRNASPLPQWDFYAWHGGILALLLLALVYNDAWARRVRRYAWPLIPLAALTAAATAEACYAEVPQWIHGLDLAALTALAALYWYRDPAWRRLNAALVSLAALVAANFRWLYAALEDTRLAEGLPWLAWGMASLAVAVSVSLVKGGAIKKLLGILRTIGGETSRRSHTGATDDGA